MRLCLFLCKHKFEFEIIREIKYKKLIDLHLNVNNLLDYLLAHVTR